MSDGEPIPEFTRETGIFVCSGDGDEELRLHRRENGKYHFHRWMVSPGDFGESSHWVSPIAWGLTATEIYDAAEALRRDADARKTAVQPPAAKPRSARSSPREP